jgi:transposase
VNGVALSLNFITAIASGNAPLTAVQVCDSQLTILVTLKKIPPKQKNPPQKQKKKKQKKANPKKKKKKKKKKKRKKGNPKSKNKKTLTSWRMPYLKLKDLLLYVVTSSFTYLTFIFTK